MAGWSGRRKKKRGGVSCNHFHLYTSFIPSSVSYVRGTHTPRMAHSAGWGRRISFVWASTQGRQPVSFVNKSTYLFGVNGRVNENKSINQSTMEVVTDSICSSVTEQHTDQLLERGTVSGHPSPGQCHRRTCTKHGRIICFEKYGSQPYLRLLPIPAPGTSTVVVVVHR
jgi:hypothetical protein